MVDVTYVKSLPDVTLDDIKADSFFDNFPLVRQSRLSVMPVSLKEWKKIIKMSSK
jgi:predicted RNA-binding protein with PUA-like domain